MTELVSIKGTCFEAIPKVAHALCQRHGREKAQDFMDDFQKMMEVGADMVVLEHSDLEHGVYIAFFSDQFIAHCAAWGVTLSPDGVIHG